VSTGRRFGPYLLCRISNVHKYVSIHPRYPSNASYYVLTLWQHITWKCIILRSEILSEDFSKRQRTTKTASFVNVILCRLPTGVQWCITVRSWKAAWSDTARVITSLYATKMAELIPFVYKIDTKSTKKNCSQFI